MDYHDHPFWTERFDSDAALRESNALSFTAEDTIGWTEEDWEAADIAMERDMAERDRCWRDRAEALEAENRALREQLGMEE